MRTFTVDTEREMVELGMRLAENLQSGDVLALDGELGAGKTQMSKGIAKGMGFDGEVTSPTFTILQHYPGERADVYHIDLYRIDSAEEALQAGLEEYLPPREGIAVIEWAGKFPELLPRDTVRVAIDILSDHTREVKMSGG